VSDPFHPEFTGSVQLGGMVRRAAHASGQPLSGGPQMIEVSRDGRRIYVTNSLYRTWDDQFYPDGIRGWCARVDSGRDGGLTQSDLLVNFGELRAHQVRLGGGDASSDSFCFG
jgi:selenium-binding protein 1